MNVGATGAGATGVGATGAAVGAVGAVGAAGAAGVGAIGAVGVGGTKQILSETQIFKDAFVIIPTLANFAYPVSVLNF